MASYAISKRDRAAVNASLEIAGRKLKETAAAVEEAMDGLTRVVVSAMETVGVDTVEFERNTTVMLAELGRMETEDNLPYVDFLDKDGGFLVRLWRYSDNLKRAWACAQMILKQLGFDADEVKEEELEDPIYENAKDKQQ